MTNAGVGKVYEQIINSVIDSSEIDFQDSGVDTSTLATLKQAWQEKLSSYGVAQFPWDPEPVPEPIVKAEEADAVGDIAADGTRIKADPDADAGPPVVLGQPLSDPNFAAARAQQAVEKRFGNAMSGMGLMLPSKPQPQTDGPDEFDRGQADEQIRQIVLEGEDIRTHEDALGEAIRRFNIQSDVLQVRPLNKKKRSAARQPAAATAEASSALPATAGSSTAPKLTQYDGPEDDDELINSDLDDTDEEAVDDDEDGDGVPQIMLCMYDKVQRTKNKWKCVLGNGILTVGGKEYVFKRANGEYEW